MPAPADSDKSKKLPRKLRQLLHGKEEKRGLLIAFEGPDGAGKTTQRGLLARWLESQGHAVVISKWGASPLVKPLLKARRKARALSPEELCLLQAADYRYRLEQQILPALWDGKMVIAEPYLVTALASESARGVPFHWLLNAYLPLLWPDLMFYFSVSPEVSGKRIGARKAPKYYTAGQDVTQIEDPLESYRHFMRRVIPEYEALSLAFRPIKVDAEQSIYQQHRVIREAFQSRARRPWTGPDAEAVEDWLAHRPLPPEVPPDGE
jgi:dTMP kinase